MVYLLFDGGHNNVVCTDVLLFCHPGEKEWRRHELNVSEEPKTMLYLKNKLHIMCFNPVYYVIEVQSGSDMDDEETVSVGDELIVSPDSIPVTESGTGGMLRTVEQYCLESFGEVFRIRKWSIRRDLGFSKGCMYFTQDEEMSLYKYDLEDQSILLSLPCPDLPTPWFQPEWLMITATPRVDDKRQMSDCILGKVEDMDKVIKVTENIPCVAWDGEKDGIGEAKLGMLASDDFVWSVSNHVHTLDYIRLRAVSKRYRAIMSLKRPSSARTIRAP
ncbi:uncharacterized protein LOC113339246 [Papaver somniferum]|uniref:uncharacterized protein LOC113339246 n=1 Tax=Papaver somniferum TaxID=3469 RepID=UPI000E6F8717|nr:uncharacterized protein LOC113339246 [Papaver somniferum]XP_026440332.1 uncharacterized protein LOC113339246 [Papaver somniferum]